MTSADVLFPNIYDRTHKLVEPRDIVTPKRRSIAGSKMPQTMISPPTTPAERVAFDAAKHLAFVEPIKVWTMEEIGYANRGVSPNAVSEPFQLFTHDAVAHMRAEVLSKEVMDNCRYSSNIAQCQLRGFAAE